MTPRYAELHARSAFSFLDGASTPEALARRAAEVGLDTLALTDLDDLGGAVRFAEACAREGVRPLAGAELSLAAGGAVVLLCEDARGWAHLCQLVTRARRAPADPDAPPRGLPSVDLDTLAAHARGLVCLSGGRDGPLEATETGDPAPLAGALADIFGDAFYVEVHDHALLEDVARVERSLALAAHLGRPWVVAADARHAAPHDKPIHDALVCLAHRCTLDEAGDRLFPNDARHLRGPATVARAWRDAPAGVLRTLEVAERCDFALLRDLRPSLPRFPLPAGTPDADAHLAALCEEGFRRRYAHPTERHRAQLRRELALIRRLGLAGYFLIVHDIVRFARSRNVLVQGRGSAANSVVCYCLGVTAVDPIGLELLFERFLSDGRGEPPDIDLDIAHRDREQVLAYVYERYDRDHAAMVCETITARGKTAVRDAARVLGLPPEVAGALARQVGHAVPSDATSDTAFTRGGAADVLAEGGIERAGLDPRDPRMGALLRVVRGLEGLPRHRGIHVGGFVLTGEPLSSVVPIEPAAMEGRTIIQWDKDDLGPVGLVKIDLLGLGMLTLLSDALDRVRARGVPLDLHTIPADDPETYALIQRADTVGVFQVESRAQMNVLPRTRPERFYDLVVQVALIRPGPIQGDMVHPYLRRRRGQEPVSYLHPMLEPVLRRTLGVPLFQEQGMKVAITAAGFSPAQADALRRAMGRKRDRHTMARLSLELMQGMEKSGIEASVAERIVKQLAAFASYGFPESHAASFALLVYASAYLKAHHAPEFYAALLDAQPMGFYPVGSILADAKRRGVALRRP
ncbi:MAG: error-prone DNA polymerase, partial [Sandaracinus sp.]|nr:error-prone DNA polymerase [Sandaracinus sp.]